MFDIASLRSSLFASSLLFQKSDKFDLTTAHIKLIQDNTEITEWYKNWNILLFREVLKTKELNPILSSGLKTSKELQLFGIHDNVIYT